MFNTFRSLRGKFLVILLPPVALMTITISVLFALHSARSLHEGMLERATGIATAYGAALSHTLSLNDRHGIPEILASFGANPEVIGAAVFDRDGTLLHEYRTARSDGTDPAQVVELPIRHGGLPVGGLRVSFATDHIPAALSAQILRDSFLLLASMIATVIAALVANKLIIGRPLDRLLQSIRRTDEQNLREPVEWSSRDELGRVIVAYNVMLANLTGEEAALRDSRRRLADQNRALQAITKAKPVQFSNYDGALAEIARIAADTLSVERVAIWLVAPDIPDRMECVVLYRADQGTVPGDRAITAGDFPGFFAAIREGLLIEAADAWNDPRTRAFRKDYLARFGIAALLDAYVQMEDRIVGVVCFEHTGAPRAWAQDELNFADAVANFVARLMIGRERQRAADGLRRSEQRLRQILEISPVGVSIVAPSGEILFTNPRTAEMLGVPPDAMVGLHLQSFCADPAPRDWMLATLARDDSVHDAEIEFRRLDGAPVWTLASLQPTEFESHPGFLVWIYDITVLKRAQQAKDEFVSMVSHELRTPLTSIRGSLGLIAGGAAGPTGDQVRRMVAIADRNADRLTRLINDILDVARIESRRLELHARPTCLAPLVEQAIEANRGYGVGTGVRIVLDATAPDLWATVDHDRFLQIMANLLSNAIKFSPRDGEVRVCAGHHEDRVRVSVTDAGPGIPEDFRQRIFDRFTQADSSDRRKQGGTGLGLSIARALVEAHGGRIGFDTGLGRGTTFHVDLPPCPPDQEPAILGPAVPERN